MDCKQENQTMGNEDCTTETTEIQEPISVRKTENIGNRGRQRGGYRLETHRGSQRKKNTGLKDNFRNDSKNDASSDSSMNFPRNPEDRILERILQLGGQTYDFPALDTSEKKFSGKSRLYIGNLASELTEEELKELFKPFGEISELFINKQRNFGFIRMDFRASAEKAVRALDGSVIKNRTLKVKLAPNGACIKVKNLTQYVSNELLYTAFSVFGEIERCVVITDEKNKHTGEGIVEFSRKSAAQSALKFCNEKCYFLTSNLRPVIAETFEEFDTTFGIPQKNIYPKNSDYLEALSVGPRCAFPGSFEYEFGSRWKSIYQLYKQKELAMKQEFQMELEKIEAEMKYAKFDHETEKLREELRVRELNRERQKKEWEERERKAEEYRMKQRESLSGQQDDLHRRQQENSLFMQARQLSMLMDEQEQGYTTGSGQENPENQSIIDPKSFMNLYENKFDDSAGSSNWHYNRENKRRRY